MENLLVYDQLKTFYLYIQCYAKMMPLNLLLNLHGLEIPFYICIVIGC